MTEIVFFLEEPSAQAMLEGLLPRLLPQKPVVRYVVFEGKQDLEKQIVRRLRGYRTPAARFVILRDKDAGDCRVVKSRLRAKCVEAGRPETLIRIACHELESWYLADLEAVEKALDLSNIHALQNRAKYRSPDDLANPADELQKLTQGAYQKILGSRAIGAHLALDNARSHSFLVFISGLRRLAEDSGQSTS
jgi:hypothetical protein